MISFSIPDLPKMPNTLLRRHWAIVMKEKNKWHNLVRFYCHYDGKPLPKARLTMTRVSVMQPDFDNLALSFKFVVDALVKQGVLENDTYQVIGESSYRWEKASKRKDQKITVNIEPLLK